MRTATIVFVLALSAGTARADTTLCTFSSPHHDIEFAGDAAVSAVYVQRKDGPHSLPAGSYRLLRFEAHEARIDFVFENPGDARLPASFTLKGAGREVWIVQGHERERGELHCGP
ncbi:hypothetical protein DWG18_11850 [Lysobacter sp. TY2-98]|uniref:hypothetical protein n=1 Tax=Lysobacter sp. TY2-98 TaxID=2290922 RepID=UPI000E1FF94F|nr:hypothetical protein [Lysobacter sp. TY2-98]AXK72900.1 hypothetical protein DWG18_11850 [Lysobacter sp. TY2-98]